ncbi:unnamed protein product [Ixodes pacificus]
MLVAGHNVPKVQVATTVTSLVDTFTWSGTNSLDHSPLQSLLTKWVPANEKIGLGCHVLHMNKHCFKDVISVGSPHLLTQKSVVGDRKSAHILCRVNASMRGPQQFRITEATVDKC